MLRIVDVLVGINWDLMLSIIIVIDNDAKKIYLA